MLPIRNYRNLPLSLQPALETPLDAYYAPQVTIIRALNSWEVPDPDTPTYIGCQSLYFVGEDGCLESSVSIRYPRRWLDEFDWWEHKQYQLKDSWQKFFVPVSAPTPIVVPSRFQRILTWFRNIFVKVF